MKHKYIDSTGFERYWFHNMFVYIQQPPKNFFGIDDFAVIRTECCNINRREFNFLKKKNYLSEITKEEFQDALNRAIEIINKKANEIQNK